VDIDYIALVMCTALKSATEKQLKRAE